MSVEKNDFDGVGDVRVEGATMLVVTVVVVLVLDTTVMPDVTTMELVLLLTDDVTLVSTQFVLVLALQVLVFALTVLVTLESAIVLVVEGRETLTGTLFMVDWMNTLGLWLVLLAMLA